MKTNLFKTESEIEEAVSNFKNLRDSAGWQIMVKILDVNIKSVTDSILNKPEGASEKDMDRLRDNLKIMTDIRNTPDDMIEKLERKEEESDFVNPDEVY